MAKVGEFPCGVEPVEALGSLCCRVCHVLGVALEYSVGGESPVRF